MAIYGNVPIGNARIINRNFAGKEKTYNGRIINPEGKRNFCVILDAETAAKMREDGWNVKFPDPEKELDPFLPVEVSYKNFPPKIVKVTESGGKTVLSEDNIKDLDWDEIKHIDLVIRPYNYEVNGVSGVKAYCKSMWVTIEEDFFEKKYGPISEPSPMDEQMDDIPF